MNHNIKPYIIVFAILIFIIFLASLRDSNPKVVVYLDKDSKQPAMLPLPEDTVIKGERAALWWSVFNKSIDAGETTTTSRYIANDAVETVYGKAK